MEANETTPPQMQPPPAKPGGSGVKKAAGPVAVLLALLAKFKLGILATLKFLPALLKTGGTMLLSIGAYALVWRWPFAAGFVLLIFVHECGHLITAKAFGLSVTAMTFIPFVGAYVLLKNVPRNVWIEALVAIGGPMLGTVGAAACYGLFQLTGNPMYSGLAYIGFLMNLFNLAPVAVLDGARVVPAISPWLWVAGVLVVGLTVFFYFDLVLIGFVLWLPHLFSLFRKKSVNENRYYEATPAQRIVIGSMYFCLIAFLVWGMALSHVDVNKAS